MEHNNGKKFQQPYQALFESGELQKRIDSALAMLHKCRVCPWNCGINRFKNEKKVCQSGRMARVASYNAHFGEENCLRGYRGSGTIFLSGCNLNCVFCQNYDISQMGVGRDVSPQELAEIMLEIQNNGCHNINLVTPSHFIPQILEALPHAIESGLKLPIVYNSGGYDAIESLKLLDEVVSIYMPDFKVYNPVHAKRYFNTNKYPEVARQAIREMHRQVGDLITDEEGIATKGLLIRHLVMPEGLSDTAQIMKFLADEISKNTFINIMAQYRPAAMVTPGKFPEIYRSIHHEEFTEAKNLARKAGLSRFD
ncbi:radical SAM protein [Candidatus Riflebacteria bacterium]